MEMMETGQMIKRNKILNHSMANVSYKTASKDVHIPIPGAYVSQDKTELRVQIE